MTYQPQIPARHQDAVPFACTEDMWSWFIDANEARLEGARFRASQGNVRRPCEPVDILRILDRLYRTRRLSIEHLRVLKFYGIRRMRPEFWRSREARAATLWDQAMRIMEEPMIAKGIIRDRHTLNICQDNVIALWALTNKPIGAGAFQ